MINELITTVYSLHIHIFQRRSQVKWLTHVKPEKNACPASALFQCSLIRSDAADHKATPPLMKNTRRTTADGHKTTKRRRRPPVRRRTALVDVLSCTSSTIWNVVTRLDHLCGRNHSSCVADPSWVLMCHQLVCNHV